MFFLHDIFIWNHVKLLILIVDLWIRQFHMVKLIKQAESRLYFLFFTQLNISQHQSDLLIYSCLISKCPLTLASTLSHGSQVKSRSVVFVKLPFKNLRFKIKKMHHAFFSTQLFVTLKSHLTFIRQPLIYFQVQVRLSVQVSLF